MLFTASAFDKTFGKWQEWQTQPWNRLYYSTSHANLGHHLDGRPIEILDVGGGNGYDTLYYVQQGHSVTLLDFSAAMLADARANAESLGLASRVSFCEADIASLGDLFSEEQFDLVLCHNMIHFVADAHAALRDIFALLRPDGLLSLIEANRYSEALRIAFQQDDLVAAFEALDAAEMVHPWFGVPTPRYHAKEMLHMLESLGYTLAGRYGIRCVTDYLPNECKTDPAYFANLERLEHALAGRYPYYLVARFFHFVMSRV
ncbi:MAG: methyltransferase domain-containing protein [Anaerolineae bacterium]|nr:methyltransferase domain-containing protein [Anaerolineae bacterium]